MLSIPIAERDTDIRSDSYNYTCSRVCVAFVMRVLVIGCAIIMREFVSIQ